jgi:hypothetical protein
MTHDLTSVNLSIIDDYVQTGLQFKAPDEYRDAYYLICSMLITARLTSMTYALILLIEHLFRWRSRLSDITSLLVDACG